MDGLIVIRSVMLSNHIDKALQPEGVVVSYHRVLIGRGQDNTIMTKEERRAIKSQRWSK